MKRSLAIGVAAFVVLGAFAAGARESFAADVTQPNLVKLDGPTKLFNGKDLTGWHADVPAMDTDSSVKTPFVVRDGMLVSLGKPGGHLITDNDYENYRLETEYRFAAKPGNCGVLVHASKPRALYKMFPQSVEVQMAHENAGDFWCIHEDVTVPEMEKRRKGPKEKWGGKDGDERRIVNLTDGSEKPAGEWNTMVIECVGDEVKVWVNGDIVNNGKCTASKGKIALQAEGSEVEFKKVDLTPISKVSE